MPRAQSLSVDAGRLFLTGEAAFVAEDACFGEDEDDVYTPALTLWGWLVQVMQAEKARSCVAAVARIATLCVALGRKPPSPDTGAYCRARAKIPEAVIRRLVYAVGDGLETRVPGDWLWLGRHVKIADGTTLLAPDTEPNQKAWPQARTQKPGLGFPILRIVALISLATAALGGLAIGPYKGKETGEPALLRELLDRFQAGDVFLGDSACMRRRNTWASSGPERDIAPTGSSRGRSNAAPNRTSC